MPLKLHQRLATLKGIKSRSYTAVTALHRDSQKIPLLSGVERVYQPRDDDGDSLPPESQIVQLNLELVLARIADLSLPLLDAELSVDLANQKAVADVVVDGQTILAQVPATYLLFLEKQISDWITILDKLPTLDPSMVWQPDPEEVRGIYRTHPVSTVKTKKVPRNHQLAPATDRHPAQVQVYHEDVPIGDWTTIRRSGCLPAVRAAQLKERATALLIAIKHAREEANSVDAPDADASAVYRFLLG